MFSPQVQETGVPSTAMAQGLRALGLTNVGQVVWNAPPAQLVEHVLERREALLAASGAVAVRTGKRTGRSPRDKFIVADADVKTNVWWGPVNRPMAPERFDQLLHKAKAYAQGRTLFVVDGFAGADPAHRLSVRVVTEYAWHALFARTLFRRPSQRELAAFQPDFMVLALPGLQADPAADGVLGEVCVALGFSRRTILIVGTAYAGEIKKAIFTVLNYLLPQQGVFPMHCSANVGADGDVALFFGLSGTGKTTLSADSDRRLVGDDEHGWSTAGVFNFEGGCYAKTIRLSRSGEPQIWDAIRFGSVLENVPIDPITRQPDFNDATVTENTRATYPVEHVAQCEVSGQAGHPRHVFFLTCDAFGVLPPISKLTHDQAEHHFLSGYTAKVAGTETGVTEPEATFSPCFGGPFMPLHPTRYGSMLRERLKQHNVQVWLVNTGWSGGPAGKASRIPLARTRAMLRAALSGALANVPYRMESFFGLAVPRECPGVPTEALWPRDAWPDVHAYDAQALRLVELFAQNLRDYETKTSLEG